jgi:predicted DCC family thiol-disulfide oxidoreductase YuxK
LSIEDSVGAFSAVRNKSGEYNRTVLRDTHPEGPRLQTARQIVLYDGVCGLCDRIVQFLLRVDRRSALTFAPLQGPTAEAVLRGHGVVADLTSMMFVEDAGTSGEKVFVRSTAMLAVLKKLGGLWRLSQVLLLVPRSLRDGVYNWIARNRYGWFGKFETCPVPSPEVRARFLA